ncbi:MAG: hypothetical protein WEB52_10225 [Dehalococcoidia bacterium]
MTQEHTFMPRIRPVEYDDAPPDARAAYDRVVSEHGRMTNMKQTLLHSQPAFRALMGWYPLRDAVQPFLGERLTNLFSHAISAETDCLICSTFFRRLLQDAGDTPDAPPLDAREQAVVDYALALARPLARVPDELYDRLAATFNAEQIVALTAFGAMMVATNIVNNALEVDLDTYLAPYRRGAAAVEGEE